MHQPAPNVIAETIRQSVAIQEHPLMAGQT